MKLKLLLPLAAVLILILGYYYLRYQPGPDIPEAKPFTRVEVGLSKTESEKLHHIFQGTTMFPLAMLSALKDEESGKFMSETLEDYGFLLSEKSERNPWNLPVGIAAHTDELAFGIQMPVIGINCAACHTGEIQYQDGKKMHRLRIDGAPNLIDVEKWILDTATNAQKMLKHPGESLAFVARLLHAVHDESGAGGIGQQLNLSKLALTHIKSAAEKALIDDALDSSGHAEADELIALLRREFGAVHSDVNDPSKSLEELTQEGFDSLSKADKTLHIVKTILFLLRERLEMGQLTVNTIKESPPAGPGRDDAWGLVQRIVMQDSSAKLNAPIVVPHLFGNANYTWFHADGNTNSVMDRNLAQGIALGADVAEDGITTSLLPRAINEMDQLLRKIEPPSWPSIFPAIDETKRARGEVLFAENCAQCHSSPAGKDYPIEKIGTNSARWDTFNLPETNGPERLAALSAKVKKVRAATMKARGISEEIALSWEVNGNPEWRQTVGYRAHLLNGIWASPPYLHNGSVRTLYQLLLPVTERETSFYVGNREFDPIEVGYLNIPGPTNYLYDTTKAPNTNIGHEFGTDLDDQDRWALVEYLKSL